MAGGPNESKKTAVAPKRTFLPSLSAYRQPADGSPKLPVRVSCFEVLKKADINPWSWFSNFADLKFTFLGRPFSGGVHNILAKHLREKEKDFIKAFEETKKTDDDGGDDDDGGGVEGGSGGGGGEEEEDDSDLFADDDDEEEEGDDDDDDDGQNDSKLGGSDAFAAGTWAGLEGPPDFKRGIKIRGARKKPTSAKLSMHFFGLAADFDYDVNLYPRTAGRKAINNVLANARLLLEPSLTPQDEPAVPWGWPRTITTKKDGTKKTKFHRLKHPDVVKINEKIKAYFDLFNDVVKVQALLPATTAAPWADLGNDVEAAQLLIGKDISDMLSVIKPRKNEKDASRVFRIAQKKGLMNITKTFHQGIGLDWGGAYGDLMHYDARNLSGDPQKIRKAIKAFAKDKKLQKELAKIWDPLKKSGDQARLTELIKQYPKP
jgi:hypothetical protein